MSKTVQIFLAKIGERYLKGEDPCFGEIVIAKALEELNKRLGKKKCAVVWKHPSASSCFASGSMTVFDHRKSSIGHIEHFIVEDKEIGASITITDPDIEGRLEDDPQSLKFSIVPLSIEANSADDLNYRVSNLTIKEVKVEILSKEMREKAAELKEYLKRWDRFTRVVVGRISCSFDDGGSDVYTRRAAQEAVADLKRFTCRHPPGRIAGVVFLEGGKNHVQVGSVDDILVYGDWIYADVEIDREKLGGYKGPIDKLKFSIISLSDVRRLENPKEPTPAIDQFSINLIDVSIPENVPAKLTEEEIKTMDKTSPIPPPVHNPEFVDQLLQKTGSDRLIVFNGGDYELLPLVNLPTLPKEVGSPVDWKPYLEQEFEAWEFSIAPNALLVYVKGQPHGTPRWPVLIFQQFGRVYTPPVDILTMRGRVVELYCRIVDCCVSSHSKAKKRKMFKEYMEGISKDSAWKTLKGD